MTSVQHIAYATDHMRLLGVFKHKLNNSQCGLVTIRSHTTPAIMTSEAYNMQITYHSVVLSKQNYGISPCGLEILHDKASL